MASFLSCILFYKIIVLHTSLIHALIFIVLVLIGFRPSCLLLGDLAPMESHKNNVVEGFMYSHRFKVCKRLNHGVILISWLPYSGCIDCRVVTCLVDRNQVRSWCFSRPWDFLLMSLLSFSPWRDLVCDVLHLWSCCHVGPLSSPSWKASYVLNSLLMDKRRCIILSALR